MMMSPERHGKQIDISISIEANGREKVYFSWRGRDYRSTGKPGILRRDDGVLCHWVDGDLEPCEGIDES